MRYKNISPATKTFYGVRFKPGETKSVPGYINAPQFIKMEDVPKERPKAAVKKQESSTPISEIYQQEESLDGSDNNQ